MRLSTVKTLEYQDTPGLPATQRSEVAAAFDALAARYDASWTDSVVGRIQRESIWRAIDGVFMPGGRILDLGCGTGIDATYLARAGHRIHAIDLSPAMLQTARRRLDREGLTNEVTLELGALEDLSQLTERGPFDGAISNFGAINCVKNLREVALRLAELIRPGGRLIVCSIGRFCVWESMWYLLHASPGKAFRRWSGAAAAELGRNGAQDTGVAGHRFAVFYPKVGEIESAFAEHFRLLQFRSIGIFVPPSYAESWARLAPILFRQLGRLDFMLGAWPGLRAIGDHRLLILERS